MSEYKNKSKNKGAKEHTQVDIHNQKFEPPADISVDYSVCNPDTCEEIVNAYGTYNIQPTANTDNEFPAIAQGITPQMKRRTRKFFRGAKDKNPASEWSDKDCID